MIMAEWRSLGNALAKGSQRWWWRATVFIVMPVYLIVTFTHVITGWPVAALAGVIFVSLVSLWVVIFRLYYRDRPKTGPPPSR